MSIVIQLAGFAILCATVYCLVKRIETRTVLIISGFAMAVISLDPMKAFNAFSTRMIYGPLIDPILSCVGFAYVMRLTKCDAHLVNLLSGALAKVKWLLIPGAGIVTAIVNIPLTSAAGASAAVGTILIPLLINSGCRPTLAAAAVYTGTFGSMLSPGNSHSVFIAGKLLDGAPVMEVVQNVFVPSAICMLIGVVSVTIIGRILKENTGFEGGNEYALATIEKPNFGLALIPLLPIAILILSAYLNIEYPNKDASGAAITGYPGWLVAIKSFKISHSMLIGCFVGMLATRTNPVEAINQFFKGAGDVYASVMGIIIAAAVFVGGLDACGLTATFIDTLRNAGDMAKYMATWGPMILAIIMGSGDAATLAFNEAVTPHAADFGMTVINMGCLANLAGALGRTCSPLAGAIIVCAGLARVNTVEIAKRTAPGMVIASFVALIWFAYIA